MGTFIVLVLTDKGKLSHAWDAGNHRGSPERCWTDAREVFERGTLTAKEVKASNNDHVSVVSASGVEYALSSDGIASLHLLHHIEEPATALAEAALGSFMAQ